METHKALLLFKSLADASRLGIVRNLMEGPMYVELLSERMAITPSTVSFHLKKLEAAGLVRCEKEQYYTVYKLNKQLFDETLGSLIGKPADNDAQKLREDQYRHKVIETFYENGRVKTLPAQHKKRLIILEEILKGFEKGRKYPEKEVNLIIAEVHDDFCTIRREMIMNGMMRREAGVYWLSEQQPAK